MKVTITDVQVGDIITTMEYGFRVIARVTEVRKDQHGTVWYDCALICKEDGTETWFLDFGQNVMGYPGYLFSCQMRNIVRAFEWACQADGHTSAVAKFEESCYA